MKLSRQNKKRKYDTYIDKVLDEIDAEMPGEERFTILCNQARDLERLQQELDGPKLDPNKLVGTIGSLAGILAILSFEQTHALSSKALSFVMKTK